MTPASLTSRAPARLSLPRKTPRAQRPVPADAHEYHARKALNDAAYASLAYKPYSSTMPVDPECAEPKWAWTRKNGN